MIEAENRLNHRAFAMSYKIAQKALALAKATSISELPATELEFYNPFSMQELLIICFDYAFSSLENFFRTLRVYVIPRLGE